MPAVRIRSFILCLFQLFSCCALAQQEALFFQQISSNNGLSNEHVNCIVQDSRGFFWIGTNDGLNRYDGKNCTVFRRQPGQKNAIAGNIITDILADSAGYLWIATSGGGISRYDYRAAPDQQFITYQHDPDDKSSIPGNIINKLLMDEMGYLWLGTSGRGVVRFNPATGKFDQLPVYTGSTVLDLEKGHDGKIWAGLQGRGFIKINPVTMHYEADLRYNDPYRQLPHVVVASLFRDSYDDIWVGSWDKKIYRYNRQPGKPEIIIPVNQPVFREDDALCFAEDSKGQLWIGGKYNGLYVYDRLQNRMQHYPHNPLLEGTIAYNRINCIYKDRKGNMWVGTERGISLHRPALQPFSQVFLPGLAAAPVKRIFDFTEDEQQNLYIGTDQGVFMQPKGKQEFRFIPLSYGAEKLQATAFYWYKGQLLVGTNRSLFVTDLAKRQCTPLPNTDRDVVMKKIIESRVVSIAADSMPQQPILWVIPYGHYLAYYDFSARQWVSRQDSSRKIIRTMNLWDNLIRKILVDRKGNRWIATAKEGLGRMRPGETAFTYFSATAGQSSGLAASGIFDVLPDAEGNIWVSTYGNGLFKGTGEPLIFRHIEGSPNLCEGLQRDEKGNLWFISTNKLYQYNPATHKFISWPVPDIEKSGAVKGYLFKDRNGNLYAGGSNFYIHFQPSAVNKEPAAAAIYLNDIRINAKSRTHLLYEGPSRFSYSNNTVAFEFAAPQIPGDEIQGFEYRMTGLGTEWIATESNIQNFHNLQPGNYTFEVRLAGVESAAGTASFSFEIIPPFYRTWWFYVVAAFAMAAALYAIYRYHINQLLKQQAMRNKIAQDLHDSVGSTLSSIAVYSQVAKIYKQQDKQNELQDTLEKITATSGEMTSEMNDIVWAINPRNDNMNTIVQRMESYARPLLQAKNISFQFKCDPAIMEINLGMEQRKNFYLIFKEAVNNALKYANCNQLAVEVKISRKIIELLVQDDGDGFDAAQLKARSAKSLSGNGLNNMQRRAKDMKGECHISSRPGKGTTVRLTFPVT